MKLMNRVKQTPDFTIPQYFSGCHIFTEIKKEPSVIVVIARLAAAYLSKFCKQVPNPSANE